MFPSDEDKVRSKKTKFCILAATLTLVLVCGCSPPVVTVTSNFDPDYVVDLDKIFVVLDTREFDDDTRSIGYSKAEDGEAVADTVSFSTHFLEELAIGFEALDVEYKFYTYTGLELSKDEYALPAKQFGADEMLWISGKYSQSVGDSGFMGFFPTKKITAFVLGAHIVADNEDEDFTWRALIEVEDGDGGWTEKARMSASSLVAKLVEDGLMDVKARQE